MYEDGLLVCILSLSYNASKQWPGPILTVETLNCV